MKTPSVETRSLRAIRARTRAARIVAYAVVVILCIAGVRTILAGHPKPAAARTIVRTGSDVGAEAFAESFARAYLAWDAKQPEMRTTRLGTFTSDASTSGAGFTPAPGTSQQVEWTAVVGTQRGDGELTVTVAAQTSNGLTYLSVPVQRDSRGFLSLAGYPAIVGAPAVDRVQLRQSDGQDVQDAALEAVVRRALGNYLAGTRPNLLADLAPQAVVSLPSQRLRMTDLGSVTWIVPQRRLAAEVTAQDARGSSWTLRYELDVVRGDRWYVRSIEVNPTFHDQGGQ